MLFSMPSIRVWMAGLLFIYLFNNLFNACEQVCSQSCGHRALVLSWKRLPFLVEAVPQTNFRLQNRAKNRLSSDPHSQSQGVGSFPISKESLRPTPTSYACAAPQVRSQLPAAQQIPKCGEPVSAAHGIAGRALRARRPGAHDIFQTFCHGRLRAERKF